MHIIVYRHLLDLGSVVLRYNPQPSYVMAGTINDPRTLIPQLTLNFAGPEYQLHSDSSSYCRTKCFIRFNLLCRLHRRMLPQSTNRCMNTVMRDWQSSTLKLEVYVQQQQLRHCAAVWYASWFKLTCWYTTHMYIETWRDGISIGLNMSLCIWCSPRVIPNIYRQVQSKRLRNPIINLFYSDMGGSEMGAAVQLMDQTPHTNKVIMLPGWRQTPHY